MSTKIGSRADLDTNVRTFVICWPILTVRVRPTWSLWSLLSCCTYARVLQTPRILKMDPSTLTITHIHCQGSTSVTSFTVAEKPHIYRHRLDRRRSLCERNHTQVNYHSIFYHSRIRLPRFNCHGTGPKGDCTYVQCTT